MPLPVSPSTERQGGIPNPLPLEAATACCNDHLLSNDQVWKFVRLLNSRYDRCAQDESPAPTQAALRFDRLLQDLPIAIGAIDGMAGDFGWPEEDFENKALTLEAEYRELADLRPAAAASRQASDFDLLGSRFGMGPSNGGSAHTTVDYERVVTEGLDGILSRIESERERASPEKSELLEGMDIALRAVIRWSERYAARAAAHAQDDSLAAAQRKRMLSIAETCAIQPAKPARTFKQALQAIRLVHVATALSELSAASLSLGRLDQYLLPLFQRDLQQGIEECELERDLSDFFVALNRFGDAACNINIGGCDASGQDQFNALSRLILKVASQLQLASPILAIRVHSGTTDEVFDLALCPELLRIGQPTFYGEQPCKAALIERGIPEAETHRWVANSCMGLMMAPNEWSDMWGSVVNVLTSVEMATNHGQPFLQEFPFKLRTLVPQEFQTFDDLFEATCSFLDETISLLLDETRTRRAQRNPNPFVSALLGDCIERGKDRLLGGCRYHTVIVEAFGLINAADALLAIRRLVFEERQFTLDKMVLAAKQNFEGHSDMLNKIRRTPKYGNDDSEADAMASRLAERFARSVRNHSDEIYTFAPSFHTLDAHVGKGAITAASLDGRQAGEAFAKNVGVGINRSRTGPTALLRSVTTIDQRAFFGGQALDLSIEASLFADAIQRKKVQALMRTYFQLGGLQIQLNGLSVEMLEEAQRAPETHAGLLVRIGGFSMPFVQLSADKQNDMIRRFREGV